MDGGSQEAHFFGEDLAKLTSRVDELRKSVHLRVQFWGRKVRRGGGRKIRRKGGREGGRERGWEWKGG